MADCEETLRELELFLDGEMSAADFEHVRHHLEECLGCLQIFDFHAELRMVIRTKCREQMMPPGLLAKVQSCFEQAGEPPIGEAPFHEPALGHEPPPALA